MNAVAVAAALRALADAIEAPEEVAPAPSPRPSRPRRRAPALHVCEDRPVNDVDAARAAKALVRYPR